MKLIDYIFYRISNAYIKKWKDKQGYIHGGGIITFIEIMLIGTILLIAGLLSFGFYAAYFQPLQAKNYLHSWTTIPVLLLFVFNAIIFNKQRYLKLETQWINEDADLRRKRGLFIVGFIISIVVIMFLLGVCLNHRY